MKTTFSKCHRARHQEPESGVALIIALFLLVTMSILGLAMVSSVSSDMMINGYYGNSRAAYYAADSGLNLSRQYLANNLYYAVSQTSCSGWGASGATGCTAAPMPTSAASTAITQLSTTFGSFSAGNINVANASVSGANAATSWPGSFIVQNTTTGSQPCTNSVALASGTNPVTTVSPSNPNLIGTYAYTFNYTLCVTGTGASASMQRVSLRESGSLQLTIESDTAPPASFAGYGQFVSNQNPCPGSFLTPGTYTGPNATNGAWTLGNTGVPYTFTGKLSSVNPDIYHYNSNGTCTGSTTVPISGIPATFPGGTKFGAPTATVPSNSFNQAWAVLNKSGLDEIALPTATNLNAALRNASGTAYPTSGSATGVYLPYTTSGGNTFTGGGIYVQGNASIVLAATKDTSNNPTETYTITQGATITTIVTNINTNTTTISSSAGGSQTISGVPENTSSIPGETFPATMLYVNGTITGLAGPSGTTSTYDTTAGYNPTTNTNSYAAIQSNTMLTVAGSGDIDITGNLLYTTEPVTMNNNNTMVMPDPGANPDVSEALGVFTANGAINLNTPYSDKNLETDGSLAAIGTTANCGTTTCGFKTTDTINTWTNVGGQIQSNEFVCSITTANTYYDQRFSQWKNFFPPWFPSTSTTGGPPLPPTITQTQQRTSWSWIAAQ